MQQANNAFNEVHAHYQTKNSIRAHFSSGPLCSSGEGWCSRCGQGEGASETSRAEKHFEMEEARGIRASHHLQLKAGELPAGHQKCQRVRAGGAACGEEYDGQELGLSYPHCGERAWRTELHGIFVCFSLLSFACTSSPWRTSLENRRTRFVAAVIAV